MNQHGVADIYPLSPMQQGMLFHSLAAPESGVYVEQLTCTLAGELDQAAFEQAWCLALARHAVLRSGFLAEGLKEPVQVVHREVELPLATHDWRGLDRAGRDAALERHLADEARRGFDLSRPPLLRLALMRIADDEHLLAWTYHHVLLDGWSGPLLFQEVLVSYEAIRAGRQPALPTVRPYRDYIVWLRRQDLAAAERHWRRLLAGFRMPTPLPDPGARPEPGTTGFVEEELLVTPEESARIAAFARGQRVTLNTLVQAAWGLLLARHAGQDDAVFGATVSGRPAELPGVESMVGLFINTLPVRVRNDAAATVGTLLRELQTQLSESRQYEFSPLLQVQGWSEVPAGEPLFRSILVFENFPMGGDGDGPAPSLRLGGVRTVEQTNYPLTLVVGAAEELTLRLLYDRSRYRPDAIRRLLERLRTLIQELARGADRTLGELELLPDAERRTVVEDWSRTPGTAAPETCIHHLFEAQVDRTPDAVAVECAGQRITYAELDRRANRIAHHLRHAGVEPGELVALGAERSVHQIAGLLGILKAGGAYVPLDPAYPRDRLAFMLEDCGATLLVTQAHLLDRLETGGRRVLCLDTELPALGRESDSRPAPAAGPGDPVYVIYTSGSTGRPKGVVVPHRGLCNLVVSQSEGFGTGPASRVLQVASLSFDAAASEIFMALTRGGCLVLAPDGVLGGEGGLPALLRDARISVVTLPPSVLAVLSPDELPELTTIISAGESLSWSVARRWAGAGRRLFNAYGPTEASIGPTWHAVAELPAEPQATVPIGRPIPNVLVHVLDPERRPVPPGVAGELYVGGVCVADGYLGRPELTAERFVADPLGRGQGRFYRTGDLARWREDGVLEFVGRADAQVKVRGFRIEVEEIEQVLRGHPGVRDAAVVVRPGAGGEGVLVAFVVAAADPPAAHELREWVRGRMPAHMVPSLVLPIERLPLSPNGKVDRAALPVPDVPAAPDVEYVAPRDAAELELAQIWAELLGRPRVGVTENFFEAGGHSLLALRLVAQVEKRLGTRLPLYRLFQTPTIEALAGVLREGGARADTPLVPLQTRGTRPPLYLIHPSGGSVHWYAELARLLGDDQPVFGLQARGLQDGAPLHGTIEEMGEYYAGAIRAARPDGPYLVASWSMGVVLALEVAHRLRDAGGHVAFLGVLDQGPVLPAREPADDAEYLHDVFGPHLSLSLWRLRRMSPEAQLEYVWKKARRARWISPDVELPQFAHFVRLLRTHTEAWRRYRPRPYPGPMTLLRAAERPESEGPLPRDLGWAPLAAGGLVIRDVPGDHLGMMHEPHVEAVARELRAALDEALQTAGV